MRNIKFLTVLLNSHSFPTLFLKIKSYKFDSFLLLLSPQQASLARVYIYAQPRSLYFFDVWGFPEESVLTFPTCFLLCFILHLASTISQEASKIIRHASYAQISPLDCSLVTGRKKKSLTLPTRVARPKQNSKHRQMRNGVQRSLLIWNLKTLGKFKTNIAERKEHWLYILRKTVNTACLGEGIFPYIQIRITTLIVVPLVFLKLEEGPYSSSLLPPKNIFETLSKHSKQKIRSVNRMCIHVFITIMTSPLFWSWKPPPGPGLQYSSNPSSCLAPDK